MDAGLLEILGVLLVVAHGLFFNDLFVFIMVLFEYLVELDICGGVGVDVLVDERQDALEDVGHRYLLLPVCCLG